MHGAWDVDQKAPWQHKCLGSSKVSPLAMVASLSAGSPSLVHILPDVGHRGESCFLDLSL